jgi:hypothetical protein
MNRATTHGSLNKHFESDSCDPDVLAGCKRSSQGPLSLSPYDALHAVATMHCRNRRADRSTPEGWRRAGWHGRASTARSPPAGRFDRERFSGILLCRRVSEAPGELTTASCRRHPAARAGSDLSRTVTTMKRITLTGRTAPRLSAPMEKHATAGCNRNGSRNRGASERRTLQLVAGL